MICTEKKVTPVPTLNIYSPSLYMIVKVTPYTGPINVLTYFWVIHQEVRPVQNRLLSPFLRGPLGHVSSTMSRVLAEIKIIFKTRSIQRTKTPPRL